MAYASLKDRVVIITGAGRGFGRLMSVGLVAAGARVLGTAARNRAELDECAAEAREQGKGEFEPLLADVSVYEDCQKTVEAAVARFGRVDVLINNAARGPGEAEPDFFNVSPPFWDVRPDIYRRMIDSNLTGVFFMAHAAAPHMINQGFGRIVNISTSRPTMVKPGLAAYGAAKAGVETSTIIWAKDLAGKGVTANVLLPGGAADTAMVPGEGVGTRGMPEFQQGKGPKGDEGLMAGILPAEIMVEPTLWLCADESAEFSGRRLVAKDWDPDLPPAEAAARAMQPLRTVPEII